MTNCPPGHLPVLDYGQLIDCTKSQCPINSYCNHNEGSRICCSGENFGTTVSFGLETSHFSSTENFAKFINDTGDPVCPLELIGSECSPDHIEACVESTCVYSWKKSKWACCRESSNRKLVRNFNENSMNSMNIQ